MSEPILTVLKFFLLALIWLFFIRVLRAQWVDIRTRQVVAPAVPAPVAARRPRPAAAPAPAPGGEGNGYVLKALEGPDQPARAFPVSGEITVGRSGGADIALAGDSFVSSRHARFWAEAGALWLEDLGSTNGTMVNGQSVSTRTRLVPGDRVQIGRTIIEVAAA